MKMRWKRTLSVLAALTLAATWGMTSSPDFGSEIRAASSKLFPGGGDPADGRAALLSLLDVLTRMSQAEKDVPEAARVNIRDAHNAFRAESSLGGKWESRLHEAWKTMSGGKAFEFPAGVKDISGASTIARNRIDSCLAALRSGSGSRAVRELLEALLIIVTPMEVR